MKLVELTNIPAETVPVAGFKDHLRLGSGFSDDGLQDDRQPLPLAPVSALLSVAQVDRFGAETVVPDGGIGLEQDMQRPAVVALEGCLPAIPVGGTVRMELRAGFGPTWSDLPPDLAQSVMMLAAHFYEYRHESATASLPFGVAALIERYRTVRVMMGGRG